MFAILTQSFWRDEAFAALLSIKNPSQIVSLTMKDASPPLYYLLLHYWMIVFGNSEPAMRSLSVLFHLLTVVVVFFLCRKLIKSWVAPILISLAVLLNPFLIQYAFEARAYSLLVLLSVLALYLVISKRYILAGLAFALATLTHNFAVLTLFACGCWFLFINRHRLLESIKEGAALFAIPALALLAWGSVLWQQWTSVSSGFWIKPAIYSTFLDAFEKYTRGDIYYEVQPMVFTLTLVLCFFAVGYWIWKNQKEDDGNGLLLLAFVTSIPLLITYVVSAFLTPLYDDRYLITTAPVLIVLIGYSLSKLLHVNHRVKYVLGTFVILYTLFLIRGSYQLVSMSTKAPINYAVSQVLSKAYTGDVIVSESNLNFLETKWYVRQVGSSIPVYTYSANGKVPFYIGAVLFEPQEIITQMPKGVRVWQITTDGGSKLLNSN